ncbi:MAG: hypothetical protein ACI4TD_09240 [Phocaeicola sp.]
MDSLKKSLGYVCKTNRGYVNDLVTNVGVNHVEEFEAVGFITKGITLRNETWRKTSMADKYYKDVFGIMAYLRNVVL